MSNLPQGRIVPPPEVIEKGDEFLNEYPRETLLWNGVSRAAFWAQGVVMKLFVNGWHDCTVLNLWGLNKTLERSRQEKRGLITVMNHTSMMDDSMVWAGLLPLREISGGTSMRWVLGARDVVFRNAAESLLFSLGQVLPVERFGRGPDQPGLDAAVTLLSRGKWVHIYPEGCVHQPLGAFHETLRYFHWGISRLVLEAGPKSPLVLPIYSRGPAAIYPEIEGKTVLGKGYQMPITYAIGDAVDEKKIDELRNKWQILQAELATSKGDAKLSIENAMWDLRSETARFIRNAVIATKKRFFEVTPADYDPRLNNPNFWRHEEGKTVKIQGLTMIEKEQMNTEVKRPPE